MVLHVPQQDAPVAEQSAQPPVGAGGGVGVVGDGGLVSRHTRELLLPPLQSPEQQLVPSVHDCPTAAKVQGVGGGVGGGVGCLVGNAVVCNCIA